MPNISAYFGAPHADRNKSGGFSFTQHQRWTQRSRLRCWLASWHAQEDRIIRCSFTLPHGSPTATIPTAHVDTNLKVPWGIAFNPKGFVWVPDNGTQRATLYDGNGVP
jgi:hypothetical protein